MLHGEKSLPPFMMLGSALVTEKDGSDSSLFVSSRNTAGMVSVRPFTPRWGREMSSYARRLRAWFPAASCLPQRSANACSSPYQRSEPS